MKWLTSHAIFVIASDRRERGNPVLLPETWGLDRHVPRIKCGGLAMTSWVFSLGRWCEKIPYEDVSRLPDTRCH